MENGAKCPWQTMVTTTTEIVHGQQATVERTEFRPCLQEKCAAYNRGQCGRVKKEVYHRDM